MNIEAKDLAELVKGAVVIITDCSIQVFCGEVKERGKDDGEGDCYQTNAIGFMADGQPDEVEVLEEEEEEEEFEEEPEG